jgi:RNA polymerase sigma factor (sigma-70 family)
MLTETPTPWSEIESFPDYRELSNVDRRALFSKWDQYNRDFAVQEGIWDDPAFQKDYEDRANKVAKGFNTWTDTYQESARNSYNLVRNVGTAAYRGWLQGEVANELQQANPNTDKVAELQTKIAENAPSAEFQTTWDEGSDPQKSWEAFKKDPIGNIGQLLAESLGAQTRAQLSYLSKIPERATQGVLMGAGVGAMGGAVATGPAAPVGAAAGAAIGGLQGLAIGAGSGFAESQQLASYANEYAGSIMQSLQESGVDIKDKKQVREAFEDEEQMDPIRAKAEKKGVPVGVFDGLSAAVGGRLFSNPAKKLAGKAAQWGAELGFQMLMGGSGEAASQLTSEGRITSPKSILAEVIAEPAAGAVEISAGKATQALLKLKPEERDTVAKTASQAQVLKENNAPLTAQALVQSTAKTMAETTEDPVTVADILEEQAPPDTFVEEPTGDERFAPAEQPRALEEPVDLEAITPTTNELPLSANLVETAPQDEIVTEPTLQEPLVETAPEVAGVEEAPVAAEPVQAAAEVAYAPPGATQAPWAVETQAAPESITSSATLASDGTVFTAGLHPLVNDMIEKAGLPEGTTYTQGFLTSKGRFLTRDEAYDFKQNQGNPEGVTPGKVIAYNYESGSTEEQAQRAKPSSQSKASFTPEQNIEHQSFIEQEPPALDRPEEAKEFSGWVQKESPKRPVILYDSKGRTAIISPSSKPDRNMQVTFMETGNDGIPEAFHDVPAESVDTAVAEAYRRGFSDTKQYKNYERTSANRKAREGAVSPDTQRDVGQRSGELPGAPESVRSEVSATNEEQLNRLSSAKVDVPAGATFIRATDSQGRTAEESVKDANKGLNIFQGAGPWVKVEAGTRDRKGNFVPIEGPVTVQDRAQAALAKKVNGFPKNQQTKAKKAITVDNSPDPYKGSPLDSRQPLRPEQNSRLISELGRIGALDDDATGKSVLEFIASDKKNPEWMRMMAKDLSRIGSGSIEVEVSYRPDSTWSALYAGNPESGRILFNTARQSPGAAHVFLHEAAHHVTLSKIEGKVDLSPTERAALENLQSVFEKATQAYPDKDDYGFTNLQEFVSEVFSSAGFRTKLDSLTAEGDKISIFRRVANAIARLVFGRPVATGSLLQSAMENAMDLAGAPVVESPLSQSVAPMGGPLHAISEKAFRLGWNHDQQSFDRLVAGNPELRNELIQAYGKGVRGSRALVAPMQPTRGSAISFSEWKNALFHPNASPEAQAKAAGELLQEVAPAAVTAEEVKPLTPEQSQLVTEFLGLAGFFAKQFDNIPGTSYQERNSEARMALIKAAQGYSPDKGEFKPYASRAIRNTLVGLYKKKIKESRREVSANQAIGDEEEVGEFQDLIETPPEAPQPDPRALDLIQSARATLSPRDQGILSDYAGGMVLRDVAERHRLSHEGVRKIIKTAGQKIIQALADAGITDIDSIFPAQEQRTSVSRRSPVSPEDEAIPAEVVGQLEAEDIQRTEALPDQPIEEDLVAPMSPIGQETRVPWLAAKTGAYRPQGKLLSAAGRWSKDLYAMLKGKNQKTRAALAKVQFMDNELQARVKKSFLSQNLPVPTQAINTALGNTDNRLTQDQIEAANGLPEAERAAFLLTAKLENLEIFRQQQEAALLSLPSEIQSVITEMRDMIDDLSSRLIAEGDISDNLQFTVDDNLGTYLHRSYAIFDGDQWAKFILSDDPKAQQIRARAESLFTQYAKSRAAIEYAQQQKAAGAPVTRSQALARVQGLDVSAEAGTMLSDYIQVADGGVVDTLRGRLPGSKNQIILKVRGDIPHEIRDLWGEHDDASINFGKTYASIAAFLENNRFLNDVLQNGLANGYIWKAGISQGPRMPDMVELVGPESSKSMQPLAGAYGPPELRDAFNDLSSRQVQDWIGTLTLAAMKAKTVYSIAAVVRNFLGNPAFMLANGNVFTGSLGNSREMALANMRKLGTKDQRERVVRYVELGILGDNIGPGVLREMGERSAKLRDLAPNDTLKALLGSIGDRLEGVKSGFEAMYSGVDDFWKIYSFESELAKLQWAEPDAPLAELEQRAADITRDTVPTYSEAFQWVRDLFKGPAGRFVAPFITFTSEVIRVTGGAVGQMSRELKSSNPKIRAIGAGRLAGAMAVATLPYAVSKASKAMFGYDDDDEDALRRGLPEWQKNATIVFLPRDGDGHPRFIDLSYLNPYNYIADPVMAFTSAWKQGKDIAEAAADASLSALKEVFNPFFAEQIFAGAYTDIRRNQKSNGSPVYNPQDRIPVKALKMAGHMGYALMPGTATSGFRIYKAARGYTEKSGRSYDLLSEIMAPIAGQRIAVYNPEQTFQFQVSRFNRSRQDASTLFSSIFNSQGTVDPGDVERAYADANRAHREIVKGLRDDYRAAVKLGMEKSDAMQTMKSQRAGKKAIAEAESGIYMKYTPGDQMLKEVRQKFPSRYSEFLKAYADTPAQEAID